MLNFKEFTVDLVLGNQPSVTKGSHVRDTQGWL